VKRTRPLWGRLVAAASAAAVALTLAVPPALAGDTASAPPRSGIAASATARAARIKLSAQAQADTTGAAASQDRGFFHSKKGVIALVLAAGVLTWTAISRSSDAVHSPARN
jgi:hypothetical protein